MTADQADRRAGFLGIAWGRRWWILSSAVITAMATSAASYYFLPTRYRSESSILVVPQRVSAEYVHSTATGDVGDRVQAIAQQVMSRTRLERIIADFNLYEAERKTLTMEDVVRQMRKDIFVNILPSHEIGATNVGGFKVMVLSSNPRTAQRVTERLASLFVEESLREREIAAEGTLKFISAQIEDVKAQLIECEDGLERLRAKSGGRRPSQAYVLEYEVLQETYKALIAKRQEAKIVANLERRQIGEQFKVVDAARLPEQPVGPSRLPVNVMGGFAGLALGLIVVSVRARA